MNRKGVARRDRLVLYLNLHHTGFGVVVQHHAHVQLAGGRLILVGIRKLILTGAPVVKTAAEFAVIHPRARLTPVRGAFRGEGPVAHRVDRRAIGRNHGLDVLGIARASFDLEGCDSGCHQPVDKRQRTEVTRREHRVRRHAESRIGILALAHFANQELAAARLTALPAVTGAAIGLVREQAAA
jgi:hypothetical protein